MRRVLDVQSLLRLEGELEAIKGRERHSGLVAGYCQGL